MWSQWNALNTVSKREHTTRNLVKIQLGLSYNAIMWKKKSFTVISGQTLNSITLFVYIWPFEFGKERQKKKNWNKLRVRREKVKEK